MNRDLSLRFSAELWLHIISFLDPFSVFGLRLVSCAFNQIIVSYPNSIQKLSYDPFSMIPNTWINGLPAIIQLVNGRCVFCKVQGAMTFIKELQKRCCWDWFVSLNLVWMNLGASTSLMMTRS